MKIMEDLDVYKLSYNLVLEIYRITKLYPQDEKFGLVPQMRRAAISIVSNLSEGGGRITKGEQNHFLGIARGSVAELKTQLAISKDLGYAENNSVIKYMEDTDRIKMMINGLIKNMG